MSEDDRASVRHALQQMDEYECENLVADLWAQRGWETRVTSESRDRGIDIVARKSSPISQKHLIQVKRHQPGNKIGSAAIQQYASLYQQEENVDAVIVVTTSSFTKPARAASKDLNVKLVDGSDLTDQILESWGEWVTEYIHTPTESEGAVEAGSSTETGVADPEVPTTKENRTSDQPSTETVSQSKSAGDLSGQTMTLSVPQEQLQKWRKPRQFLSVCIFATLLFGSIWVLRAIFDVGLIVQVVVGLGVGICGFILFVYGSYKALELVYS